MTYVTPPYRPKPNSGFTLLELLVVMIIVGVMSAVSFRFLMGSMAAYADAEQRFAIIESVDSALSRMTNDIAQSLPYSVRIMPNGRAIEFVQVVEAGYYREKLAAPGDSKKPLEFSPAVMSSSSDFSLLGGLKVIDQDKVDQAEGLYADLLGPGAEGYAVVVGHYGDLDAAGNPLPGFNIYSPPAARHVVSAATITNSAPDAFVRLPVDHEFPTPSGARRIHIVNGFVSYICRDGLLFRRQRGINSGRTLQQDADVPARTPVLARGVTHCSFEQDRGSFFQAPTVSVELRLAHPNNKGELVLFRQVRVKSEP